MTTKAPTDSREPHLMRMVERRLGASTLLGVMRDDVEEVFRVPRTRLLALVDFLHDDRDCALDVLVDLTAIDGMPPDDDAFLLVVRLRSTRLGYRARLECPLPKDDPTFPSLTSRYRAADWLEREVHDLFGLFPDGHPFVRRLILYPGFAGHPLRRDYPLTKSQPLVPLREPPRPPVVIDAEHVALGARR